MKRTVDYVYDACGLDNVILLDLPVCVDDTGDEVVTIQRINALHRVLMIEVARKEGGLTPKEIRFLRTELGLSQAQLAELVGRDGQTVGRWERGETPVDRASEIVIRRKALEHASADGMSVDELSRRSVYSAVEAPIRIQADDPANYRPAA